MLRKFSVRLCQIVLFLQRELPSLHVFIRDLASLTGKGWKGKRFLCAQCVILKSPNE